MNDVSLPHASAAELKAGAAAAYRDIAVHLDGTPEDEVRLAHAEALAVRFGGRLTGLFTNLLPNPASFAGDFGVTALGQLTDSAVAEGDVVERRLRQRLARIGSQQQLRRIETFPGLLEEAVARETRWNDLFVATCARDDDSARWEAMVETALFDSARGLYLLPPKATQRSTIQSILIAWVDSRESARAVAEAMPLIAQASSIQLVTVQEEPHGRMGGAEVLADITGHLAHHGINVDVAVLPLKTTVSEAILQKAYRSATDLIVAGAYGHSRFREWILGGVTRDLLATSPIPLLLAH